MKSLQLSSSHNSESSIDSMELSAFQMGEDSPAPRRNGILVVTDKKSEPSASDSDFFNTSRGIAKTIKKAARNAIQNTEVFERKRTTRRQPITNEFCKSQDGPPDEDDDIDPFKSHKSQDEEE